MLALLVGSGFYLNSNWSLDNKHLQQRSENSSASNKPLDREEADLRVAATQAKEDEYLTALIKQKLDRMPEDQEWSVYVRDLKSDRMAGVEADKSRQASHLYGLFLLSPLESKLSAYSWKSRIGGKTTAACVEAMIRTSDDKCSKAIGEFVGWEYADKFNSSLGLKKTRLSNPEDQKATAREVGDVLFRLQNSQLLSDKARRIVFDGLYASGHNSGIPATCPEGCLVAHKTGDQSPYAYDGGIVTHGNAKYVVVIMSKNGSWEQVSEVAAVIDAAMQP